MRSFDYSKLAEKAWDMDIVNLVAKIHECKGRQDLFVRQKPVELDRLVEIAKIQSTEASNKIEGIVTTSTRMKQLFAEKTRHGRRSAEIARPFLEGLGLAPDAVNEICYGIAIHVDDRADFEWERTPFCETVGDADNIDRFDAYRIYETLQFIKFSEMSLDEKKAKVTGTIEKLNSLKEMKLGTATAKNLWLQRLDYYIGFYEKLKAQLSSSSEIF